MRRWEIGVESIGRRGASELSSRWWRTVLPRPIARVKTRWAGIHAVGGHLSNRESVSGRLYSCRWWSPTAFVQLVGGFVYRQPDSRERMRDAAGQRQVQTKYQCVEQK